ncbi:hypothetical protein YC2023_023476 [Brassica napus]
MNYQEFRIAELRSSGVENLNDEKIAELVLLEEEEDMNTSIYPMLQYYSRYICKQPTKAQDIENDEHDENNTSRGEEEFEAGTYMQIVCNQIVEQIWAANQCRPRRQEIIIHMQPLMYHEHDALNMNALFCRSSSSITKYIYKEGSKSRATKQSHFTIMSSSTLYFHSKHKKNQNKNPLYTKAQVTQQINF